MNNILQYFNYFKPKKQTMPELVVEPKNVCPRCSSDSGFRTNDSIVLENWRCEKCNAVWMTINETT